MPTKRKSPTRRAARGERSRAASRPPQRSRGAAGGPKLSAAAPAREPRNHRELAQAIFAECNAVEVGRELLQSGSERGATVRARMFETLTNWQFGKPAAPAAAGASGGVRVIWDLPAPPHEHRDEE